MLILAADTSGKQGSIALARCEAHCEVIEVVPLQGGTFSAQLVPQIATLLKAHKISKADLGGFAVASGPGSFTGLRVGLAAIKGLAEVLRKPIVAVSLLEAVARSGAAQGGVLAAMDAGRDEVYVGEYQVGPGWVKMLQERLVTFREFVNLADGRSVVTPDRSVSDLILGAGLTSKLIEQPRSDAIARLGWEKLQSGETIAVDALEANYIRRSDAEIFAKGGS